jgi:hypothetical protein
MLAKPITYTDFNGLERTETFYFNITKGEIAEMELTHPGGYLDYIERIIAAKDQKELTECFTQLILSAYGEKTEDGRHFRKSKEISDLFHTSEAYSELLMELLTDVDAASAFVNGIMPKVDLTQEQQDELNERMKARIEARKQ